MLELSLDEVVKAVDGELLKSPKEYTVKKVSTDTRKIEKDTLFVALKGAKFNGNTYVKEACSKGANLCIVDELLFDLKEIGDDPGIIIVKDTRKALMNLAKFYREKLGLKVIGITGSVGKTSTKDLLAALLSSKYKVFKTKGNFNNDIGLPLMVLELDKSYDIAILEMGMSALGEIETLVDIARPDMAVISNIGICHIENLKTRENILKAKMEITTFFNENNVLAINGDDDMLSKVSSNKFKVIKAGMSEEFDIYAKDVVVNQLSSDFTAVTPEGSIRLHLDMPGLHNVQNIMPDIAIARELGVTLEEMKDGLNNLEATSMRFEIIDMKDYKVIDDSYNSSPIACRTSTDIMMNLPGKRKICVFGTMKQLGDESEKEHRGIGEYAKEKGIDLMLCCGDFSENIAEGFGDRCKVYKDKLSLIQDLKSIIEKDDLILVKASRGMHFEDIVKEICSK
ncbi:UDP-N-acetylmuramoyl-tripeptide--D-alanyl-D-alanine ligase [Sarcina sp. JB2]|uniref:UDP-N-acetylmuramoyl-tripeptide--D-alanyl-D-alanine ligase n=1 Tax=Candidatus Sarcina troglodytae TaxID=2726954 RepID=A0ACD1BEI3_9CLOT|nr:UDP-N-acetylmuramoyl-tripeptide--D-alanyl-D-alanine ligase [Sarcina sp. JB2]QPJ85778.1 UDP-N-acetylmuramoyl-tripeptide--D-alanyl-D-alanine ligase [Sarcina sp. JB2]